MDEQDIIEEEVTVTATKTPQEEEAQELLCQPSEGGS